MASGIKNVTKVVTENLCVSCCACKEVCGADAITYKFRNGLFLPNVDIDKCIDCGLCLKLYPSYQINVDEIYGDLDIESIKDYPAYITFAKDESIQKIGTSGGTISAIVHELLCKGVYEKAYVLNFENFTGDKAVVMPITNAQDIYATARSKYIPSSIEVIIRDIKNNNIDNSIIVGTPCQFLTIKKYLKQKHLLENKILFLGLFCDKTLNYNIYKYYAYKYGKFSVFHFRDKKRDGWPGNTLLKQGNKFFIIDKKVRMALKPYFQLNRCRYCFDKLNQLADISFGDCYISGEESFYGKSNIIVRTVQGEKAFDICKDILECKEVSWDKIKISQRLIDKNSNLNRGIISNLYTNVLNYQAYDISQNQEYASQKDIELGMKSEDADGCKCIDNYLSEKYGLQNGLLKRFLHIIKRLLYNPDKSYVVLIDNAGFSNKGAQLMLMSVVEQIQKRKPLAKIVVPEGVYFENPTYCIENGIYPLILNIDRWTKKIKKIAYRNLLNSPEFITSDQVDLILDAGGFQFGDQWSSSYSEDYISKRVNYYKLFTKRNRKIIFLPQAFGPFEQNVSQRLIRAMYNISDVMYARENTSYKYLQSLFKDSNKIKFSPDFTILCNPSKRASVMVASKEYILVIPNVRMLTHTDATVAANYFSFLKTSTQYLIDCGEKVILLNHEGFDDENLLLKLNSQLSVQLPIITHLSAKDIKYIIGNSKLIICSRFHGVVNGLVQGIPTLCTSWSHKYEELLEDHHCKDNILEISNKDAYIEKIKDALLYPQKYVSKDGYRDVIRSQVEKMWEEVFK